jgi:hypothetical protein
MAARGVLVSYESVRRWCEKCGHLYAAGIRRRRARTGDKWHLDEVFLKQQFSPATQNQPSTDLVTQPALKGSGIVGRA